MKSLDSADNGWPYGLMSGSLANIYVVGVLTQSRVQSQFHIQTGVNMKGNLDETQPNNCRRFFTCILD